MGDSRKGNRKQVSSRKLNNSQSGLPHEAKYGDATLPHKHSALLVKRDFLKLLIR